MPEVDWRPPGELGAEEAFSVYDHPPVWIFAKTDAYSSENTRQVLESIDLSQVTVMNPLQATQARNGLLLSETNAARQQAGGTFVDVFNPDGLLSRNPWLAAVAWVVATILLGWLAFPLAFVALGGLPDRGYALSRVLGLLLLAYIPWLAASTDAARDSQHALLNLAGAGCGEHGGTGIPPPGNRCLHPRQPGTIVFIELLGLALFGLMIVIRLGNPDVWDVIWGGEKPMDLAYFTASLNQPPSRP